MQSIFYLIFWILTVLITFEVFFFNKVIPLGFFRNNIYTMIFHDYMNGRIGWIGSGAYEFNFGLGETARRFLGNFYSIQMF